jgi:hypothetical protein
MTRTRNDKVCTVTNLPHLGKPLQTLLSAAASCWQQSQPPQLGMQQALPVKEDLAIHVWHTCSAAAITDHQKRQPGIRANQCLANSYTIQAEMCCSTPLGCDHNKHTAEQYNRNLHRHCTEPSQARHGLQCRARVLHHAETRYC